MYLTKDQLSNVFRYNVVSSIDLCIIKNKKILLGKRQNNPAKDFYFVPGGRIMKGEKIDIALERIIKNETGQKIIKNGKKNITLLGVYEHFYEENFLGNKDFSSHYVVLAYVIDNNYLSEMNYDTFLNQHSDFIWQDFTKESFNIKIHNYSIAYLSQVKKLKINNT